MSNPKTHAAQDPNTSADPQLPLRNLTQIRTRIDSLRCFLSDSINSNAPLTDHQTAAVSDHIAAAIHHTIANAAAILSFSRTFDPPDSAAPPQKIPPRVDLSSSAAENARRAPDLKIEAPDDDADDCAAAEDGAKGGEDDEVVELDAVELLAEHIHFCEICGKGFRRDANLRMHMRAHGNQFKTPEALAKPESASASAAAAVRRRFSCPFDGCNRNKHHRRFRPLKSIVCVKNHFKRSHCPKMYSCNRCHKKNFSVLSDLKSHMKHCGESKWRCSCGTTFSRKDKLFGHIALFEGHMPALPADEEEKGKQVVAAAEDEEDEEDEDAAVVTESELGNFILDDNSELPDGFFDDLDDLSSLGFPLI